MRWISLGLAVLVLAGCGGGSAKVENDLKELGLLYLQYQAANGKPPTSLDDLKKSGPVAPGVGQLTVVWGGGMGPLCKDGPAGEFVIANGPAAGGKVPVLMADGSTRQMPQADFDKAKKVKPKA